MKNLLPITKKDSIALIWPGSPCVNASHPSKVQALLKERYGLGSDFCGEPTVCLGKEQRAEQFMQFLFDDKYKLLMALRGGEGSADIIPILHQHHDKIKQLKPKILMGFSDFTAILLYFEKYYNWPVIHGPSPLQFLLKDVNLDTEQLSMDFLLGKTTSLQYTDLTALNSLAAQEHTVQANITGGCLSLINISIKDIWEIETQGKILILEDVGEAPFSVLRTLKYLSRIGKLDGVKAIIFGDFNCNRIGSKQQEPAEHHKRMLMVLKGFAEHHSHISMLHTKLFGHGEYNLPFVMNVKYVLSLGKKIALTMKLI